MALVARDLHYSYGAGTSFSVRALTGATVEVHPGDLLVVTGTTGSGKSTLLRLLAGLLEPQQGGVEVDGLSPRARAARGRVGVVFQNPETQFFAETLLADVMFGPRNLGLSDAHEAALSALAAVGLDPAVFGDRSPFTLSGGEARRGAIAGALAMQPRYLLLDEPTAGLDASGRREVLSAIAKHRASAGVVVVTHDPDEFLPQATQVLALADGMPVFAGTVAALLDAPEAYEDAQLRLPEVVRVQTMARQRGAALASISFDPAQAADALVVAWRGTR